MKTFRRSVVREIRRFGADRTLLIITTVIPILLTVCYAFMFARGTINSLPVAVVDLDQTVTSRQLGRMVGSTPTTRMAMHLGSVEQAKTAMKRGEINAFVYIPLGMEAAMMNGTEQAQVGVYINGAFMTTAALLKRDLTTVMQAFNIGAEVKMLGAQGIPAVKGYGIAYPVAMDKHILFNPFGSYSYYLLPGMLSLVLIIMLTLTVIYAVGSEFRYGTAADWVAQADGSITRAIVSKLSIYLLIFFIITMFMDTILYKIMGLPFEAHSYMLMSLGKIFLILAYAGIGVMLVALTSNMRFSLSIGAAYTIAAFSFAGLTFPHMGMYKIIAAISTLFPYTYYTDLFIEQSIRGAAPARSLGDLAAMGVFILLSMAFLPMLKRKAMGGSKYYGKL